AATATVIAAGAAAEVRTAARDRAATRLRPSLLLRLPHPSSLKAD
ncbi:MAG: hypothetical protein FD180_610, partial [Planctomycetota bacterium]